MRPSHIRVFDGLRVTTEHMNHLQGSFQSALQEIREALGVPKVYRGFTVTRDGDHQIIVHPGMAFDNQGNRVVFDEPKTLAVQFAPNEDTQLVCVQYDQIEDGQVEGRYTIIWDTCSVVLRATAPEASENVILIAKLIKSETRPPFEIIDLVSPQQKGHHSASGAKGSGSRNDIEGQKHEKDDSTEKAGGKPPQEAAAGASPTDLTAAKGEAGEKVSQTEQEMNPRPIEATARIQIQQGTLHMPSEVGAKYYLSGLLLEELQKTLGGRNAITGGELLIPLVAQPVDIPFRVSSASCYTLLNATVTVEKLATSGEQPERKIFSCRTTAHGESTFTSDQLSQFALSASHLLASTLTPAGLDPITGLTELSIAQLPFEMFSKADVIDSIRALFNSLFLTLRVDPSERDGFKVTSCLVWKGEVDATVIEALQQHNTSFTWEAIIGWKAIGEVIGR